MKYIIVSNKKIKGVYCGQNLPEGAIEVPRNFDGAKNEELILFNEDWSRKSVSQLVNEKIIKIKKGYKLEDDKIVEMTLIEKVENGLLKLKKDEKIENGQIVQLTLQEKIEKGIINKKDDEYIEFRIMELKTYLNSTDWYIIRKLENGDEIPEDISKARENARKEISKLKSNY